MKKLLALVLALVMVMGLATVGASAKTEYSDKADINYDEAVAVMSAIGVLEGADGKFRPTAELKRSEAAKIVAYLNTNNKTAEGLVGVGKFQDVPTNHWAAGYVDYLTSIGVIAGKSATSFDPDGDLKAIDFAKMLLVVIGFDPKLEGLTGNDYKINVSKLANNADIFKGMPDLKADDVLTREQAAQMAFNTIKAATVEYNNKGGEISLNGATVSLGASNFNYVTSTLAAEQRISKRQLTNTGLNQQGGYTVEFGERQYPKLRLDDATDDFGRPVNEWTYDKDKVGKFLDKSSLIQSWTTAVTGADMYNAVGESKIKNSKKIIYMVNGYEVEYEASPANTPANAANIYKGLGVAASNMIRSNKVPYGFTGNGVLTEIYEKNDNLYVVTIVTYVGKATADYNAKMGTTAFKIMTGANDPSQLIMPLIRPGTAGGAFTGTAVAMSTVNTRASAEDVAAVANLKKDDYFLARLAYDKAAGNFKLAEMDTAELVKDVPATKYSTKDVLKDNAMTGAAYEGYVVASGAQKDFSKAVYLEEHFRDYNQKVLDTNVNLIYDKYGYVIFAEPVETKQKYVFIAGLDTGNSNLGAKNADAFAIFADGTSATIKVNLSKSNEKITEYEGTNVLSKSKADKYDIVLSGAGGAGQKYVTRGGGGATANAGSMYMVHYDSLTQPNEYAYNRWFSYEVSGEGANAVYTLYPTARMIMVGQSAPQTTGYNEIDKAAVAPNTTVGNGGNGGLLAGNANKALNPVNSKNGQLQINTRGARLVGTMTNYLTQADTAVAASRQKLTAYGNEKSVYITVQTGKVSAANYRNSAGPANLNSASNLSNVYLRGIAEVTGIYTGIQSVDLYGYKAPSGVTNATKESDLKKLNPFQETVMAVKDSDGYIIAAVVIGTDNGNTDNYIYAVSSAGSEWKEGGKYYWNFNAIVDGEEKVLTCKTEYPDVIDTIKTSVDFSQTRRTGSWVYGPALAQTGTYYDPLFKVTLDKDGYVTNATQVTWDEHETNNGFGDYVFNNYDMQTIYVDDAGVAQNRTVSGSINKEAKVWETQFYYDKMATVGNGGRQTYMVKGLTLQNELTNQTGASARSTYAIGSDIGLTIVPGAPIYVLQQYEAVNGITSTVLDKCQTFEDALGTIAGAKAGDPVGAQAGNLKEGNFGGYISAALDSTGRAKWVVIKNVATKVSLRTDDGSAANQAFKITIASKNAKQTNGFEAYITGLDTNAAGATFDYELQWNNAGTWMPAQTGTFNYNGTAAFAGNMAITGQNVYDVTAHGAAPNGSAIFGKDVNDGVNLVKCTLTAGRSYRLIIYKTADHATYATSNVLAIN